MENNLWKTDFLWSSANESYKIKKIAFTKYTVGTLTKKMELILDLSVSIAN